MLSQCANISGPRPRRARTHPRHLLAQLEERWGRQSAYSEGADANQAAKRDELHALLVAWRKSVKAPVPTEKNPEFKN